MVLVPFVRAVAQSFGSTPSAQSAQSNFTSVGESGDDDGDFTGASGFQTTSVTPMLSYPLDLESNPQSGHFIMFTAKKRTAGTIKSQKANKNFDEIMAKLQVEASNIQDDIDDLDFAALDNTLAIADLETAGGSVQNQIEGLNKNQKDKLAKQRAATAGIDKSIQLQSFGTQETVATIQLYMPPNVSVNYGVKYGEQEIGNLALIGKEAFEGFKMSAGKGMEDRFRAAAVQAKGSAREALLAMANASLDTVFSGARTLSQLSTGSVVTPRMELMFEGIDRRNFSYSFVFIPKSEKEAKVVEEIVYQFKENMMPEYSNADTRREMDIPNTFEIDYMYKESRNSFLNKIHTCFLKSIQVQYGGDRYTAYEPSKSKFGTGPSPQKTTITLEFSELELITKDHIKQGF
jgi:hypothetical protein|tara:strand:+ start:2591 stop:3802 length:1212 start_codon:yes stop_codon:yes gene_type:complete